MPSDWGMRTLPSILLSLRVAETGGDVTECADALEAWMGRHPEIIEVDNLFEARRRLRQEVSDAE